MRKNGPTIFISYSHVDTVIADRVSRALEKAGLNCWIDKQEFGPGHSFISEMNRGIGDADYVLLLLSSASVKSRWVSREWMSSLAQGTVVIPVLLSETVAIPPILSDIINFRLAPNIDQGLDKITSFFAKELCVPKPVHQARKGRRWADENTLPDAPQRQKPLWERSPRTIRLVAMACIDTIKFKGILFDLDINENDVEGSSLNERILWLLHKTRREHALVNFARCVYRDCKECVAQVVDIVDRE